MLRSIRWIFLGFLALGLLGSLMFSACSREPEAPFTITEIFQETAKNVVIPCFAQLADASKKLEEVTGALCKGPSAPTLEAAQKAWREVKSGRKRCEIYRFGPAKKLDIKGYIDWWPTKTSLVDKEVEGTAKLDAAYIDQLGASRRGLPAMEYLLFSAPEGKKLLTLLGEGAKEPPRRCLYVKALAEGIYRRTKLIHNTWKGVPVVEQIKQFSDASQDAALDANFQAVNHSINVLIEQLAIAMDRRLGKPLGKPSSTTPKPDMLESLYAGYSKEALLHNLQGVRTFYLGNKDKGATKSISALVRFRKASLDDKFQKELDAAIQAVKAIQGSLKEALAKNKAQVEKAYQAVREARVTATVELVALLGVTLTFSDNDGD